MFLNVEEVFLGYNLIVFLAALEFNSNSLKTLDFRNNCIELFRNIVLNSSRSLENLRIILDKNNLTGFPRIEGYFYLFGSRFEQALNLSKISIIKFDSIGLLGSMIKIEVISFDSKFVLNETLFCEFFQKVNISNGMNIEVLNS